MVHRKSLGEVKSDSYWVDASIVCQLETPCDGYEPRKCQIYYTETYDENDESDVKNEIFRFL